MKHTCTCSVEFELPPHPTPEPKWDTFEYLGYELKQSCSPEQKKSTISQVNVKISSGSVNCHNMKVSCTRVFLKQKQGYNLSIKYSNTSFIYCCLKLTLPCSRDRVPPEC